ncbi:beta-lactamase family protein [Candidatus Chloroploca sp. M-50]|uniref:Beta-lactamase family protein n=1 Tax=Candidatus Chloroploca mongolica TaxID=2528176 RepID=A0ABS4DFD7_9CHLR|nr:serine hydrolase domain-containing protein [Candidatus Chloroploca mongolica]MBP1468135.1 beta-lactamase family protein [Candidatus Chloroploca mongolica]
MRYLARVVGLTLALLVGLTTCSTSSRDSREPSLSGFVATPLPSARLVPTILPTVTPEFEVGVGASTTSTDPVAPPLAAVTTPSSARAQPTPDLIERAGQMDAYMSGLVNQGFSGAVLVAYQGNTLISRGYGLANREAGIVATSSTRFRLASVTKPITALAVLRLVAAGKVQLEASICAYLDPCPATWQAITVADLLRHNSGIPNYTDFASFASVELQPATPEAIVARFRDLPLNFVPGSMYHYSNSNYVLLGLIIERASGQTYADFLQNDLFTLLEMSNSGLDPGDFSPLGGTRGYAGGALDIPLDVSNLFAAGDLYASVEDLHRLTRALYAGLLLPPELMTMMTTPRHMRYGMGWLIEQRGDQRLVYHPGWMSGANTWLGHYPDTGLTIVILSNNTQINLFPIADALAGLALN